MRCIILTELCILSQTRIPGINLWDNTLESVNTLYVNNISSNHLTALWRRLSSKPPNSFNRHSWPCLNPLLHQRLQNSDVPNSFLHSHLPFFSKKYFPSQPKILDFSTKDSLLSQNLLLFSGRLVWRTRVLSGAVGAVCSQGTYLQQPVSMSFYFLLPIDVVGLPHVLTDSTWNHTSL